MKLLLLALCLPLLASCGTSGVRWLGPSISFGIGYKGISTSLTFGPGVTGEPTLEDATVALDALQPVTGKEPVEAAP